jgi:hypothetical protein
MPATGGSGRDLRYLCYCAAGTPPGIILRTRLQTSSFANGAKRVLKLSLNAPRISFVPFGDLGRLGFDLDRELGQPLLLPIFRRSEKAAAHMGDTFPMKPTRDLR